MSPNDKRVRPVSCGFGRRSVGDAPGTQVEFLGQKMYLKQFLPIETSLAKFYKLRGFYARVIKAGVDLYNPRA